MEYVSTYVFLKMNELQYILSTLKYYDRKGQCMGQFHFNIYLKCSILKLEKRLENFHLLLLVISQYLSGHFVTFLNFEFLLLLSISLEENMKSFIVIFTCSATLCTSTGLSPIFYVMCSCTICY